MPSIKPQLIEGINTSTTTMRVLYYNIYLGVFVNLLLLCGPLVLVCCLAVYVKMGGNLT